MRKRARVDQNQREIIEALRATGCSVLSLAPLGNGAPDILASRGPRLRLMEIKDGKGALTEDQEDFHRDWNGAIAIVRSVDEALAVMRSK